MLRKLIFVVCAVALTLASCGRQVTPNRSNLPSGLTSGQMQIQFSTQGTLDFVDNWYVLAFNTSGTGTEPYALYGSQAQNWLNYSFEIVVYQPNASSSVQASVWQFVSTSGPNGPQKTPVHIGVINPQDLIVTANCNGNGTQFCITFSRSIFDTPYCTATSTPSSAPTGSSPTPSPTASPTTSPSPSSNCVTNTWYINWFVASPAGTPAGQVIASAGYYGINDTIFVQKYNINTSFSTVWTQGLPPLVPTAPSQSSQIIGGAVSNVP